MALAEVNRPETLSSEPAIAPPGLQVVPLAKSVGGVGTGFVKGAVIGAVAVFFICGGIALIAGTGLAPAIGVGAFAAFWGGPGFGGMMGAVLHDIRHPES